MELIRQWMNDCAPLMGLHPNIARMILGMFMAMAFAPTLHGLSSRSSQCRHVWIVGVGMSLAWLVFEWQIVHSILACGYTWIIFTVAPRRLCGRIVAIMSFGHLLWCHIVKEFVDQSVAHDSAQMVLVLKLTSLAFQLSDGENGKIYRGGRMRDAAVPSILHLLSFVYFFPTLFVGPTFEFDDYMNWIDNPKVAPWSVHLKNFVQMVTCAAIHFLGGLLPIDDMDNPHLFPKDNPLLRGFLLCCAACLFRFRFYLVWTMSEMSGALAGVGYNDASGEWDLLRNINILLVELPTNPRLMVNNWNIKTAQWLNKYIYSRVGQSASGKPTIMSTIATFLTSAIWHGPPLRYYWFFLSGGLFIEVGKALRRSLRPYFHRYEERKAHPYAIFWKYKDDYPLAMLYDVLGMVLTWVIGQYTSIMFEVRDWKQTMLLWKTYYFVPHIGMLVLLLILPFIPKKQYKIKKS